MHGALSGYIVHGIRRLAQNAPYFVPPFAVGKDPQSTQHIHHYFPDLYDFPLVVNGRSTIC
jgi:hypothetical protein